MENTILKFKLLISRITPDSHGPNKPAKKPYAVNTIPKIFPKFSRPKTSVTSGAEIVNMAPKASPIKHARKHIE